MANASLRETCIETTSSAPQQAIAVSIGNRSATERSLHRNYLEGSAFEYEPSEDF